MDSALDQRSALAGFTPDGLPSAAADTTLTTVGTVYAVDAESRMVRVGVRGSVLWLPAAPGRYAVRGASMTGEAGAARVLLDPMTSAPVCVLHPVTVQPPSVPAVVLAVGSDTVTVAWDGDSLALPAVVTAYTVGGRAWVDLDDWGQPYRVGGSTLAPVAAPSAPPAAPDAPSTASMTATVSPQWSDTWRTSRSAWGQWQPGTGLLHQGSGYGSGGTLVGLATYGDQIVNLGADSIARAVLRVRRGAGGDTAARALTVRGTPAGSQPPGAPAPAGTSTTLPAAPIGGWVEVDLPADVREALRTGAVKSLAAVGMDYTSWGGTGTPGSMVLTLTYTRAA